MEDFGRRGYMPGLSEPEEWEVPYEAGLYEWLLLQGKLE